MCKTPLKRSAIKLAIAFYIFSQLESKSRSGTEAKRDNIASLNLPLNLLIPKIQKLSYRDGRAGLAVSLLNPPLSISAAIARLNSIKMS